MFFYRLQGTLKYKDWGMEIRNSIIKKFIDVSTDDQSLVGEIWFSSFGSEDNGLREFISSVCDRELKFILKILSINSPLSLQVHPTQKYSDAHNLHPKPEGSVALGSGKLFKGLLPFNHPHVVQVLHSLASKGDGKEIIHDTLGLLEYLCSNREYFSKQFSDLWDSFAIKPTYIEEYLKVCGDELWMGIVMMLLDHQLVSKGDVTTLPSGIIHSYLQGEYVECMSPSDCTIRFGMTPREVNRRAVLEIAREEISDQFDCEKLADRSSIGYENWLTTVNFTGHLESCVGEGHFVVILLLDDATCVVNGIPITRERAGDAVLLYADQELNLELSGYGVIAQER